MLRGWKGKLAATGTGLVLAYVLVEIIVLLTGAFESDFYQLGHQRFYQRFQPHPNLGYVLRPGLNNEFLEDQAGNSMHITSDSLGFTNPGKDYNTASVFFLGDSFTFGSYVESDERFFGLIDAAVPSEMVNLGLSGYDFGQYREMVNHLLPSYKPDTAVFCIFANDLWRLESTEFLANYYDSTGASKYKEPQTAWQQRTFAHAVWNRLARPAATPVSSNKQPNKELSKLPNGTPANLHLWRGRGIHPDYFANDLHLEFEHLFRTMLIDLKRKGITPCVLFIPSKEACYPEAYAELYPDDAGYLKKEADAYKRLWSIAADEAVAFLDLTPAFRDRSESEQLYFDLDGHWNKAGHAYAAELILQAFWNQSASKVGTTSAAAA